MRNYPEYPEIKNVVVFIRDRTKRWSDVKTWTPLSTETQELMLTFIFCFDAESLVWTLVSGGHPQTAGDPKGHTSLLDFFTMSHV